MTGPSINIEDSRILSHEETSPICRKIALDIPDPGPIDAGQFAHLRVDLDDPSLLRRPFSFWNVRSLGKGRLRAEFLYTIAGKGTEILSRTRARARVGYMGPLGRGFTIRRDADTLIFVAGGVGIVPFYLFTKQIRAAGVKSKIILIFGGRSKMYLHGIDDFDTLAIDVRACTDDGSRGMRGLVTDLLEKTLAGMKRHRPMLYTCGPERMMERVVEIARARRLHCEVSMEKRMGCALGACAACVTKVWNDDRTDWRYSRICIEGPTYDIEQLA